jgi:hypothetical protein
MKTSIPMNADRVPSSVAAKGGDWIDGRGSTRGNPRSDERDGHEQHRGQSDRERIDRFDAKEESA